jgi:hypothetical protein
MVLLYSHVSWFTSFPYPMIYLIPISHNIPPSHVPWFPSFRCPMI